MQILSNLERDETHAQGITGPFAWPVRSYAPPRPEPSHSMQDCTFNVVLLAMAWLLYKKKKEEKKASHLSFSFYAAS